MNLQIHNLSDLLQWHFEHYPKMQVKDVYKLLYQAAMGAEHLLLDVDAARNYLFQECENIQPLHHMQLYDPVSLDGNIVRLNFARALIRYSAEEIWDIFYNSAKEFTSNKPRLLSLWNEYLELNKNGLLPVVLPDVQCFCNDIKDKNFPVMHHSLVYRDHYKPSYRIVNIHYLKKYGVLDE